MTTQVKINRYEMTPNDRYLVNKARASRILGLTENDIEFVYLCNDGRVLIGLFNDSIYLTISEFKVSYGQERKERSNGLRVTKRLDNDYSFTVRNETKNHTYKVECFTDSLRCDCPDFEISTKVMNTHKVCCKHGYAVLGKLGYTSLKDYILDNKTGSGEQLS